MKENSLQGSSKIVATVSAILWIITACLFIAVIFEESDYFLDIYFQYYDSPFESLYAVLFYGATILTVAFAVYGTCAAYKNDIKKDNISIIMSGIVLGMLIIMYGVYQSIGDYYMDSIEILMVYRVSGAYVGYMAYGCASTILNILILLYKKSSSKNDR